MIAVMEKAVTEIPVIELVHPMPGFPDDARFALVRLDDAGILHAFRSLDHDDLEFVVVSPSHLFPAYTPVIDENAVADLGISSADIDEALVLLVVRAGATLADTTVNLRAPIVVNPRTLRASQVILDDGDLPLAAPLAR